MMDGEIGTNAAVCRVPWARQYRRLRADRQTRRAAKSRDQSGRTGTIQSRTLNRIIGELPLAFAGDHPTDYFGS